MSTHEPIIEITFSGTVPPDEMEAFLEAVAEAVHSFGPRTKWDPMMGATYCATPGHGPRPIAGN